MVLLGTRPSAIARPSRPGSHTWLHDDHVGQCTDHYTHYIDTHFRLRATLFIDKCETLKIMTMHLFHMRTASMEVKGHMMREYWFAKLDLYN